MPGDPSEGERPGEEDAEGIEEDSGDDCVAISFQPGNLRRKAGACPSFRSFPTLSCDSGDQNPHVCISGEARKLTPVEWERLQGFPDNFSRIPWDGAPEEQCPDHLRQNAIGNSMCVPVMSWIGRRIDKVNAIANEDANG
jgi:DNA (cytosine-5)-methyltransferase 1